MATAVAFGAMITGAYFTAIQYFASQMIVTSLVISVLVHLAFAVLLFSVGGIIPGVIMLVLTLLTAYVYYSWRFRIPFAKVMLTTVVTITKRYPGTFVAAIIGLIVGAAMSAWWLVTVIGILIWSKTAGAGGYALVVFCMFFFYWASAVITNSVHLTVSGRFCIN